MTAAALAGSDFLRAPVLAAARPEGFKEWHHFVVQGRGFRLLINFSLNNEVFGARQMRLAPRVIVIAHDQKWTGAIERFDDSALDVSADLGELTIGGNRMTVLPDGYHVAIDLPDKEIRGDLHFASASRPFVVNNQPVGDGRMCWLFVPRLCRAHPRGGYGSEAASTALTTTWSYHDTTGAGSGGATISGGHGAPFLPDRPNDPWSMVFLEMTDRSRWFSAGAPVRLAPGRARCDIGGGAAVHTRNGQALLGRAAAAPCRLDGLLLDGEVPVVPERIEITATSAGDIGARRVPPAVLCPPRTAERGTARPDERALQTSGTARAERGR